MHNTEKLFPQIAAAAERGKKEKKMERGRDGEKHIHCKEKLRSLNVPKQCPLVLREVG